MGDRFTCPTHLKRLGTGISPSDGRASPPISDGGAQDLRKLILRTLNQNQVLVLKAVADRNQSLTSLLKQLSEDHGVPLSTLKLNARILRELNMISYGSIRKRKSVSLEDLGRFIFGLLDEPPGAAVKFSD